MSATYPSKEKVSKQLSELMSERERSRSGDAGLERGRAGTLDHMDPEDVVENVLQESQLLMTDEPDIVASTKPRTPPGTLAETKPRTPPGTLASPACTLGAEAATTLPTTPMSAGLECEVFLPGCDSYIDPVAPPRRKKKIPLTEELVCKLLYIKRNVEYSFSVCCKLRGITSLNEKPNRMAC